MGDFNIQVEAPLAELHGELLAELDAAELEPDDATAAEVGIRAAMSFTDVVGDASVDAGLDVSIEGETGKNILVSVTAVPSSEEPVTTNVPGLEDEEEVAEEEAIALAMVGQHANPETGDPLVDNVPGHPEAEWEPSTVTEAVVEEPENEEQDNQMAGLEPDEDEEDEAVMGIDTSGKTVDQVLEEVGDDAELAEEAKAQEEASARPRVSLIGKLDEIIDAAE